MSVKSIITKIPTIQKEFNIFTSYIKNPPDATVENTQSSIKVGAIKDNIATKDFPTTCASDILKNYSSPFDSTVVSLLKKSGALIIGKTNLDEFGMGSLGLHTTFGPTKNPLNKDWCVGGSSSGSAAAVASGIADFSLGTDTGGSVRLPAAYSAIYGFKPSYGRISRWGVVAFAQSLDTVGIFANNIDTVSKIFHIIDQHDPRDPTSLSIDLRKSLIDQNKKNEERSKPKIGIPKEFVQSELAPEIKESFMTYIQTLLTKDYEIYPISLPSIKDSLSVYYTLAPAEAASNLSRYDGIRYGKGNSTTPDIVNANFYNESRSNFGQEVKNRIILGNYNLCSDGYRNNFIKAQQLRVQIINQFDKIFRFKNVLTKNEPEHDIDIILCPTNLNPPPPINYMVQTPKSNPLQEYMNDIFTIPMSLAGLPAISVPFSKGKPYGVQISTQYGNDEALMKFVKETVF
ncbi:similar to Saccharomyces cerevisiae YMR293C HER2 Subunit of the trimeric GatFAB AmidoTransferase(AdT) complex [Maudiozyma barnettii]|uniref:Glutamyl-tRNA(Gln) amidotransferase subunit A, mitochondrial n=1 Tax=Maudiozyma barnettii TaxID=61262 RepID=A0A8H2VCZ9_9SACH|nr:glutamyl-tRNA(Gln) amidotransferase subunit HER2 [Kazachstania barnettii]CAB4253027.1 similar to Saccharomyces cerevisiae YMR293C HER2 Subunit of the trimeric GatFAB AmidoTransferase(AdT) complex [Kazachstania barnettii]CAD1780438.1 similar to Saccharomyces cerevisiae YMR293C HER2 Subunit of the trimeric GatFAB AmidoTransferase(AdT) complex [Kazachstania barnettii]